jgi:hypothetical protein
MLAADVGAGEGQIVAQEIGEILPAVHPLFTIFTVADSFIFPQLSVLNFHKKLATNLPAPHLGCFSIASCFNAHSSVSEESRTSVRLLQRRDPSLSPQDDIEHSLALADDVIMSFALDSSASFNARRVNTSASDRR